MKKFLNLMLVVLGISSVSHSQNRSINFIEEKSFTEIKELAKKENKMIMVDGFTTWCGPCKWMAKNVFTNDTAADFFNKNFINVEIDMEKGEGIELKKKYEIYNYPTFIFLSAEGEVIHRACGKRTPQSFIQLGMDALDPEKQFCKIVAGFSGQNKNGAYLLDLLKFLDNACMPTGKLVSDYFSEIRESELSSEINWRIINRYVQDLNSREFQFVFKNYTQFSLSYGDSSVYRKISSVFLKKVGDIYEDSLRGIKFLSLKEKIKKSDFPKKEVLISEMDLAFFRITGQWDKVKTIASSGVVEKLYWNYCWTLIELSSDFNRHISDTILLHRALTWAKRSVELSESDEPAIQILSRDAYAHLLFKLGFGNKAIEVEESALGSAVNIGQFVDKCQKALDFFKNHNNSFKPPD